VTETRALIYIPPGKMNDLQANQCLDHCLKRGYQVAGVIKGDWDAVLKALDDGLATVVVVARRTHLDPSWESQIEFVGKRTRDLTSHMLGRQVTGGPRRARVM
jgi:hypothetical protein